MSESQSHKRAKAKAAGKKGNTEVKTTGNRRIDAVTKKKATEVERSGDMKKLEQASSRLKSSRKKYKILQVPKKDMSKATAAMKKTDTKGTVKNMSGTKRRSVR